MATAAALFLTGIFAESQSSRLLGAGSPLEHSQSLRFRCLLSVAGRETAAQVARSRLLPIRPMLTTHAFVGAHHGMTPAITT